MALSRAELEQWLTSRNYTKDRFGHYHKETPETHIRYKLSSIAARIEKRVTLSDNSRCWVRVCSGYYKNLSFNEHHQLAGMR